MSDKLVKSEISWVFVHGEIRCISAEGGAGASLEIWIGSPYDVEGLISLCSIITEGAR